MLRINFLLPFFFLVVIAQAQVKHPKNGKLFDHYRVHRIDIFADTTHLAAIERNRESNQEYPADFIIHYADHSDTIKKVGIRPKGNFSRNHDKVSFKIGFNTFVKGRKYLGQERLSLNGYNFVFAHFTSYLSAKIMAMAGVPTTRSGFAELYINNEFRGLHCISEHVDGEFTKSRYGSKSGNLFKCLLQANLTYRGESVSNYDTIIGKRPMYGLKNNKKAYDYSGLMELTYILTHAPLNELPEQLEKRFNVEDYIKELALEVLLGHWDGSAMHCNNYYLYDNPKTGKFDFIPYDFDLTFGVEIAGVDMGRKDIYNWPPQDHIVHNPDTIPGASEEDRNTFLEFQKAFIFDDRRPIYYRLLEVETYRNQYNYWLNYYVDEFFNNQYLDEEIDRVYKLLEPSLVKEYPEGDKQAMHSILHNGNDDFVMTIGSYRIRPAAYGIKEFIEVRSATVKETLEPIEPMLILNHLAVKRKGEHSLITVKLEGDAPHKVGLYISENSTFKEYIMNDKGGEGDKTASDGIYSYRVPTTKLYGQKLYVTATLPNGDEVREPVADFL